MLSHWHQWHAAYPTLSNTGTPRRSASANASGPHSHQSRASASGRGGSPGSGVRVRPAGSPMGGLPEPYSCVRAAR